MIAAALEQVRARMAAAARAAGRDPGEVKLLAVSKTRPPELIREAYQAGQLDFGENYAQELRDKARALADLPNLRLHAIGPLQANKVKYVAPIAASFHALDRLELAMELSKRCAALARSLPCYVEVSLAQEEQKAGVGPEALPELLEACAPLPGIKVVGLMCLPPHLDAPECARPYFARLRELRDRLRADHPGLTGLSMGMSGDFEVAIAEGATVVRVGSSLFGARG